MLVSFSISELANEFDITTRTIRFYEEKGLLSPTRKGQQRVYSNRDRVRLKLILRGKRLGMTLEQAAEIISLYDPSEDNYKQQEATAIQIKKRRSALLDQLHDIEQSLLELDEIEMRIVDSIR